MDFNFIFTIAFSSFTGTLGLLFNGYILFVLLWERRIRTPNQLLLLHLASVDIIFCVVILVGNISLSSLSGVTHNEMDGNQLQSLVFHVQGFLWSSMPIILIWSVCGLSCDRYMAISSPLEYNTIFNTKKAGIFIVFSWILAILMSLPPVFNVCSYKFSLPRVSTTLVCSIKSPLEIGFVVTYWILALLLPLLIILLCNLYILSIARSHRHRIVSAIYEITLRSQTTISGEQNACFHPKVKGKDAFFTISELVGALLFLSAPWYIIFLLESVIGSPFNTILVSFTTALLTSIPAVNGLLYGVKSRLLRQTFKRLIQRYLYKQQATTEIDRRISLRSQSSLGLTRHQRRNSAPIFLFTRQNSDLNSSGNRYLSRSYSRRLSLDNTNQSLERLEKTSPGFAVKSMKMDRRPSFLAEPNIIINVESHLSPIQEMSNIHNISDILSSLHESRRESLV